MFNSQNHAGGLSSNEVWLFAFVGESNSGGRADNADLTTDEKAARSAVQIRNNTTGSFQSLDIETNNLIGHTGLSDNAYHGWENGLAYKAEDGTLPNPVYLVKCGQGGSQITDWNVGGTYWNTMVSRIDDAIADVEALGKTPRLVVWYSLGINDILLGATEATWKTNVQSFFSNFRTEYGATTLIIMTEFMTGNTAFDDSIQDIAATDAYTISIPTAGIYSLEDANHWDAVGMKDMAAELVEQTLSFYQ